MNRHSRGSFVATCQVGTQPGYVTWKRGVYPFKNPSVCIGASEGLIGADIIPSTATNTPKYTTPGTPLPEATKQMMKPAAMLHMGQNMNGER